MHPSMGVASVAFCEGQAVFLLRLSCGPQARGPTECASWTPDQHYTPSCSLIARVIEECWPPSWGTRPVTAADILSLCLVRLPYVLISVFLLPLTIIM